MRRAFVIVGLCALLFSALPVMAADEGRSYEKSDQTKVKTEPETQSTTPTDIQVPASRTTSTEVVKVVSDVAKRNDQQSGGSGGYERGGTPPGGGSGGGYERGGGRGGNPPGGGTDHRRGRYRPPEHRYPRGGWGHYRPHRHFRGFFGFYLGPVFVPYVVPVPYTAPLPRRGMRVWVGFTGSDVIGNDLAYAVKEQVRASPMTLTESPDYAALHIYITSRDEDPEYPGSVSAVAITYVRAVNRQFINTQVSNVSEEDISDAAADIVDYAQQVITRNRY